MHQRCIAALNVFHTWKVLLDSSGRWWHSDKPNHLIWLIDVPTQHGLWFSRFIGLFKVICYFANGKPTIWGINSDYLLFFGDPFSKSKDLNLQMLDMFLNDLWKVLTLIWRSHCDDCGLTWQNAMVLTRCHGEKRCSSGIHPPMWDFKMDRSTKKSKVTQGVGLFSRVRTTVICPSILPSIHAAIHPSIYCIHPEIPLQMLTTRDQYT